MEPVSCNMVRKTKILWVSCICDGAMKVLGIILLVLGILKFHGLLFERDAYTASYLSFHNPFFGFLTNRPVLAIAASLEIFVGWHVLCHRGLFTASLLLWFSGLVVLYKVGLASIQYHGPCGCLFGVNTFLPFTAHEQRTISEFIIIATFVISAISVAWWLFLDKKTCLVPTGADEEKIPPKNNASYKKL